MLHSNSTKGSLKAFTYLFWFNLSASEILYAIQETVFCKFIVCSKKLLEL